MADIFWETLSKLIGDQRIVGMISTHTKRPLDLVGWVSIRVSAPLPLRQLLWRHMELRDISVNVFILWTKSHWPWRGREEEQLYLLTFSSHQCYSSLSV